MEDLRKEVEDKGYTGFKWTGKRYEKNLDTKEIAKRIRGIIADLVKQGDLPRGKYSVTMDRYAGGSSIYIGIKQFPFPIMNVDWVLAKQKDLPEYGPYAPSRHNQEAREALVLLEKLINSFRFNDSDSQIDYFCTNFYGSVGFSNQLESDEIDAIKKGT